MFSIHLKVKKNTNLVSFIFCSSILFLRSSLNIKFVYLVPYLAVLVAEWTRRDTKKLI